MLPLVATLTLSEGGENQRRKGLELFELVLRESTL